LTIKSAQHTERSRQFPAFSRQFGATFVTPDG